MNIIANFNTFTKVQFKFTSFEKTTPQFNVCYHDNVMVRPLICM